MSNDANVARRYAKALAEVCEREGVLAAAQEQMLLLADMLDPNRGDISVPELLAMIYGPRIPKEDKEKLADLLSDQLSFCEPVRNLWKVLIRRKRVNQIGQVDRVFQDLASTRRNVAAALVESARPLKPEVRELLVAALKKVTGDSVELIERVKPFLSGGARIRVKGRMFDGSVFGALGRIEQKLSRL